MNNAQFSEASSSASTLALNQLGIVRDEAGLTDALARLDYPERSAEFQKHSLVQRDAPGVRFYE